MDSTAQLWKEYLWGPKHSKLSEIIKATINMEQYRMIAPYLVEPDLEPPQEEGNTDCLICRKIICVLTSATPFSFKLGTRDELLQTTCPFHIPIILHSITAELIPIHNRIIEPVVPDENSEVHVSRHCPAMSLRVFQDGLANCSFQLVQNDCGSILKGHGKIINTEWVDPEVLQSWYGCCQKEHADSCQLSLAKANPNIFSKRPQFLIDTWRMCLTEVSEEHSYVALSYVWGSCTTLRTSKQNLTRLKKDQSLVLAIQGSRIPKTILHAIFLVGILKERYLWVDSLCIIHDDEVSKHQQIKDMASIYANSILTIIAAEGNHADHGICGIQGVSEPRDCQQHIFELGWDQLRMIDLPWPLVSETAWFNRGWTYQEWLFSSRRLIFGDKRVRWECNHSHWQEDVDHISGPTAAPFPTGPDDIDDIMKSLLTVWPDTVGHAKIVRFYNTRNFTYEEDVLPAFAGITSILASRFDGGFLYGLPEMFFDTSLLWIPYTEITRRVPKKLTAPWLQGSQLPSWSWMGWDGQIDPWSWLTAQNFYVESRNKGVVTVPTVKWYTGFCFSSIEDRRAIIPTGEKYLDQNFADNGGTPLPWTRYRKPDGEIVYKHPGDLDAEFSYPVPMPDASTPAKIPQQTPLLFFSAQRIWLSGMRCVGHFRPGVALKDCKGSWAGFLNLHDFKSMDEFLVTDSRRTFELIAISMGSVPNEADPPHIDEMKMRERPRTGMLYEFMNVLVIAWDNGIAYRKGCGRVLLAVWQSEARESIDVILG